MTCTRMMIVAKQVLILFVVSLTTAAASATIDVDGRVQCSASNGVRLALTLKNLSDRSIEISTGDLPWGMTSSIFLIVVTKTSAPELLAPIRHFDDPRVGSTTLKPLASATGEIDLQRRFPDLLARLKNSDLLVVWSYKAEVSEYDVTSTVVGSVLIERSNCIL